MLPQILKNFNVFANGVSYAGRAEEVSLPKLTVKTEEFRGGGMDAPVELDMGMEKMDFFWYLKNISSLALLGYIGGAVSYMLLMQLIN